MPLTNEMIVQALQNIGNGSKVGRIFDEVIRVNPDQETRKEFNRQNVSARLQHHWYDSPQYQGPPDLFFRKGKGLWHLKPTSPEGLWADAQTDDPVLLENRAKATRSRLGAELGGLLPPPPPGTSGGQLVVATTTRFVRDPDIVAWVLMRANGTCEVCEASAPFRRSDGDPFLEVHHIRFLADGGPDRVDNSVAACPNCHRELHHGARRDALRAEVIARIERLIDHPTKPIGLLLRQSE